MAHSIGPSWKRSVRFEVLENRDLLAANPLFLQNPLDALDINFDGRRTVQDVSALVQRLHLQADGVAASTVGEVQAFLDANGDGRFGIADLAPVVSNMVRETRGAVATALGDVVAEIADSAPTTDHLQDLVEQHGGDGALADFIDDVLAQQGPAAGIIQERLQQLTSANAERIEALRSRLDEIFEQLDVPGRQELIAEIRDARQAVVQVFREELTGVLSPLTGAGELLPPAAAAAAEHLADVLHHAAERGEQQLTVQVDRLLNIVDTHEIELPAGVVAELENFRDGEKSVGEAVQGILQLVRDNAHDHHDLIAQGIDQVLAQANAGTVQIPDSVVQLLGRIRDGETPVRDFLESIGGDEQPLATAVDEVLSRAEAGELPLPDEAIALLTQIRDQLPPASHPLQNLLGRIGQRA